MQLDTGQWIVIVICSVLIAGYIGGFFLNRRMARRVLSWLQPGLESFGHVTPGEPLGGLTSGGSLNIFNAREPYQRIEALFLLEPRDNLIFWCFDWLRGRRDELVLRISLRLAPPKETMVEAGRRFDRNYRQAISQYKDNLFSTVTSGGLEVAYPSRIAASNDRTRLFFEHYGGAVTRLSIQRHYPHIFVRARLKTLLAQPAQEFISTLGEICQPRLTIQ